MTIGESWVPTYGEVVWCGWLCLCNLWFEIVNDKIMFYIFLSFVDDYFYVCPQFAGDKQDNQQLKIYVK